MPLETDGLSHIAIRVTDLARAKRFYSGTLEFAVAVEEPGLVIVNANGVFLALKGDAKETAGADRFDPFRVGLDHIALAVADAAAVERLRARLDQAGVHNNGVERDPTLGGTYVCFHDPDGIALELYALPK